MAPRRQPWAAPLARPPRCRTVWPRHCCGKFFGVYHFCEGMDSSGYSRGEEGRRGGHAEQQAGAWACSQRALSCPLRTYLLVPRLHLDALAKCKGGDAPDDPARTQCSGRHEAVRCCAKTRASRHGGTSAASIAVHNNSQCEERGVALPQLGVGVEAARGRPDLCSAQWGGWTGEGSQMGPNRLVRWGQTKLVTSGARLQESTRLAACPESHIPPAPSLHPTPITCTDFRAGRAGRPGSGQRNATGAAGVVARPRRRCRPPAPPCAPRAHPWARAGRRRPCCPLLLLPAAAAQGWRPALAVRGAWGAGAPAGMDGGGEHARRGPRWGCSAAGVPAKRVHAQRDRVRRPRRRPASIQGQIACCTSRQPATPAMADGLPRRIIKASGARWRAPGSARDRCGRP